MAQEGLPIRVVQHAQVVRAVQQGLAVCCRCRHHGQLRLIVQVFLQVQVVQLVLLLAVRVVVHQQGLTVRRVVQQVVRVVVLLLELIRGR